MQQHAAADDGDVRFFELAYLEAEIKQAKKLIVHVTLKDFVIPNTELIPEEVRNKVKKWSDLCLATIQAAQKRGSFTCLS
jgi:hypothetical protein